MVIQAFQEDEVAKIYKNKLIYSIIKYNKQKDSYKDFFSDKFATALKLSNSSFDSEILDETVECLEKEKTRYNEILNNNQIVIDIAADEIVNILVKEASNLNDEKEKCRFLVEYIANTFEYDRNDKKYNRSIPFGEDYNFEFYHGIPISKSYKGLLVTKTGLSDSISNLLVYLGNQLGLKIGTISCTCNDESYMINSVNIDGNISYIDATSILADRCEVSDACLVDCSNLNKYASFKGINEEGITQVVQYAVPYDFTNIINIEKRILPATKYIDNDIYTFKKTS